MTSRLLARAAGLAIAAGLVAAACGGGSDTAAEPAPVVTEPQGADAPAPSGIPEALAFSSPLVGGGQLDAATLADKPTAFWFWAPT
ncbi:MAG: hypothetical protein AB8G26_07080 [Ilumatobacter sp.]